MNVVSDQTENVIQPESTQIQPILPASLPTTCETVGLSTRRHVKSTRQLKRKAATQLLLWSLLICLSNSRLFAQAGLREALEKLDVNQNGMIESDEVTPLARPYLERIILGQSRRVEDPFRRPMRIDKIQESARVYFAIRNGVSGADVQLEDDRTVKPFGLDADQPIVPEFGLADVKFAYVQTDVDLAESIMQRYDFNGDGFIDRDEAKYNRWTHRDPFADDLNNDDRISRMELIQRYARRRLIDSNSQELVRRAWRTGGDIEPSDKKPVDDSQWWKKGGSSHWLTAAMMGRFDANRNGRLETQEALQMGIPIAKADENNDGELTREELHILVTEMQDAAGDVTEGLPGWFFELDADRDGQVAMHEFSTEWSLAKREEFNSLDINGDGILTDTEILRSAAVTGGSYQQDSAEVLPPRRTVISEIEVEDDYPIRDLDVQISITHTSCGFLDAYLTGPDGQRIELFAEVGGSGDHFEKTIFDDQAPVMISKGQPPFVGRFRPHATEKRQPGLSAFNGKSVKGVWQLVVRGTRSERFGMLHSWGLTVVPEEDDKMQSATTAAEDSAPFEPPTVGAPVVSDGVKSENSELTKKADKENREPQTNNETGNSLLDILRKSPF